MKFIADLHVHSRYSRATSKTLGLESLYLAAKQKGITVVGTGDFTHPEWFCELQEKLLPDGEGLFRLKPALEKNLDSRIPKSLLGGEVRFILQAEISNIYKKDGKTRKNHSVVMARDLISVAKFNARLDRIGNIKSDGRPILGLDVRNLLEILLETSDKAFLVPAHIWTPWFSVFGSKSGFDSLEECFGDLTGEIFAVETGLSSDPPMNWRVSQLNGLTLIANSDAHSPMNLGRNANFFQTELSYAGIKEALKTGNPKKLLGTFDLYPEEGKYHFDGHRKCGVCLDPRDSHVHDGICPVCKKPLTLGVLSRVEDLADRPPGFTPEKAPPCHHIIPLAEILSEILRVGPKTKKVERALIKTVETLGPEMAILHSMPLEEAQKANIPLLCEALKRMRSGKVHISPGYDGEYGKITVFTPDEITGLMGQQSLFNMPCQKPKKSNKRPKFSVKKKEPESHNPGKTKILLNREQKAAVELKGGSLIIVAGPGAGKTRTLTEKMTHSIKNLGAPPETILGVTFTTKAAREMQERLKIRLGESTPLPFVATFHALSLNILKEEGFSEYSILDPEERKQMVARASDGLKGNTLSEFIRKAKQNILTPKDNLSSLASKPELGPFLKAFETYESLLARERLLDFEDLILKSVTMLEGNEELKKRWQNRFQFIFVDEYQDLNMGQHRLVKALAPNGANLTVIGDPDQCIYGFSGSHPEMFKIFGADYPLAKEIRLSQNYRSNETILSAASQVIKKNYPEGEGPRLIPNIKGGPFLTLIREASEKAEAVAVGKIIESMVGGTGFHSIDFGKTEDTGIKTDRAFSDFAVLARTKKQGEILSDVFTKGGIPHRFANREHALEQKGARELISLMKIICNKGSINDFSTLAKAGGSGVGEKSLISFEKWAKESGQDLSTALESISISNNTGMNKASARRIGSFVTILEDIKKKAAFMDAQDALNFCMQETFLNGTLGKNTNNQDVFRYLISLAGAANGPHDFFETLALQSDTDLWEEESQKVAVMTIHASKGLEFPVVFITGCEDGLIPYKRPNNDGYVDIEEERRLFYVAITRAKEQLFLTMSERRSLYGKRLKREISPFVGDMEGGLLKYKKRAQPKRKQKQLRLF